MSGSATPIAFDIPLKVGMPQTFLVTLAGVDYRFTLQWRDTGPGWIIDILDINDNPLVCGMSLVTGANLLEQFDYLNFGGELWVMTDGSPAQNPTFSSLGATSHLRFITGGTLVTKFV